jgi:hypothetical protein
MMPLLGRFPTDSFLEMHGMTKGLAVATLMWSHIWSATFRLGDMSAAALVAVPQNTPERDGSARIIPHKAGSGNASRAVTRLVVGVRYKSARVLGKKRASVNIRNSAGTPPEKSAPSLLTQKRARKH